MRCLRNQCALLWKERERVGKISEEEREERKLENKEAVRERERIMK